MPGLKTIDRTQRSAMQRWTAAAAVAGGALWIVFAALVAGKPEGCVGDACLTGAHRDLGDLNTLFSLGGLLIVLGFAGAAARVRSASGPSTLWRASVAGVGGGVALILAGVASGAVFDWDSAWYVFVVPGMAASVIGFALAGVAILRAGVAPRWAGLLLVATSLALFAANDQDARVLMLIPFGVAWILVGSALLRRPVLAR